MPGRHPSTTAKVGTAALLSALLSLAAGCSSSHGSSAVGPATTHSSPASVASAPSGRVVPTDVAEQTVGATSASQPFGSPRVDRTTAGATSAALPNGTDRVQAFTVPTAQGDSWNVQVILPRGYFDPANARRTYPVIAFAHGVPGSNTVWFGRLDLMTLLDPLVAQRQVQPFIAVVPEVSGGGDGQCVLGPRADTETEQWLTQTVPAFITSHLRVMRQREGWAMAGYSAGGWCSAAMPVLHPNVYAAGIVLSGYFTPWWGALKPDWPAGSAQERRLRLDTAVAATRPKVALFVMSARDDKDSWPSTQAFLDHVSAPTSVTTLIYPSGGHSFDLWTVALQRGVAWLGREVPGFRP